MSVFNFKGKENKVIYKRPVGNSANTFAAKSLSLSSNKGLPYWFSSYRDDKTSFTKRTNVAASSVFVVKDETIAIEKLVYFYDTFGVELYHLPLRPMMYVEVNPDSPASKAYFLSSTTLQPTHYCTGIYCFIDVEQPEAMKFTPKKPSYYVDNLEFNSLPPFNNSDYWSTTGTINDDGSVTLDKGQKLVYNPNNEVDKAIGYGTILFNWDINVSESDIDAVIDFNYYNYDDHEFCSYRMIASKDYLLVGVLSTNNKTAQYKRVSDKYHIHYFSSEMNVSEPVCLFEKGKVKTYLRNAIGFYTPVSYSCRQYSSTGKVKDFYVSNQSENPVTIKSISYTPIPKFVSGYYPAFGKAEVETSNVPSAVPVIKRKNSLEYKIKVSKSGMIPEESPFERKDIKTAIETDVVKVSPIKKSKCKDNYVLSHNGTLCMNPYEEIVVEIKGRQDVTLNYELQIGKHYRMYFQCAQLDSSDVRLPENFFIEGNTLDFWLIYDQPVVVNLVDENGCRYKVNIIPKKSDIIFMGG